MSVYALGDLHGHYEIYEKVKAMLKPEDTVYFLGDAGDRGPESWKCIKAIYNDPQFIYIKGNHEDMLLKSYRGNDKRENFACWLYNGGINTLREIEKISKEKLEESAALYGKSPYGKHLYNVASGKYIY